MIARFGWFGWDGQAPIPHVEIKVGGFSEFRNRGPKWSQGHVYLVH